MNRITRWGIFLCSATFLLALLALFPQRGEAIPAFARRINAKCSQCHLIAGELNLTGKDFLRRGFRDFEETTPDVQPGVGAGAPEAAAQPLESAAAGPSEPPGEVERRLQQLEQEMALLRSQQEAAGGGAATLSDYLTLIGKYGFESEKGGTSRFGPGEFALWVGGPLSPKFSFVAEVEAAIGDTDDEASVEVEELYGQYTSGIGANYSTVRFGAFQPILLTTHQSGAPRIILERPTVLSGRAANGNGWRPRSRLRGVELGLVRGKLAGYVGLGNGQGQNMDDSHMDLYATLERTFDDNGSSLGAWSFWGDTPLTGPGAPADGRDGFNRWGIFGNYATERSKLTGAFLSGKNESSAGDLDNRGFFVQALHLVAEDTALYARWDNFRRDTLAGDREKTRGTTVGGRHWLASQLAITVEAGFLKTDGERERRLEIEAAWLY